MIEIEKVGLVGEERIINIGSLSPVYSLEKERIIEVAEKFSLFGFRSIPIVDKNKKLVGIVTITDILNAFLKNENFFKEISSIMTREVIFVESSETIRIVLNKMKISKRGRLPIVEGKNKLVGVISETDFLRKASNFSVFENMKIEDVMIRKPFCIFPKNTILDVIKIIVNTKYRRLPVVEGGNLVGYITSTKLFSKLFENKFSVDFVKKPIADIMTRNPIVVQPTESLSNVLKLMNEKKISSMLIVKEGRIEGIFTERDYINLLE